MKKIFLKVKELFQIFSSTITGFDNSPRYRVIKIYEEEGYYSVLLQSVNTSHTFVGKPENILADDNFVDCFLPRDVRLLTYAGYFNLNEPEYKILAEKFIKNSTVFIVKKRGETTPIEKSAAELHKDSKIVSQFGPSDARKIGYTTAAEEFSQELLDTEEIKKTLISNKVEASLDKRTKLMTAIKNIENIDHDTRDLIDYIYEESYSNQSEPNNNIIILYGFLLYLKQFKFNLPLIDAIERFLEENYSQLNMVYFEKYFNDELLNTVRFFCIKTNFYSIDPKLINLKVSPKPWITRSKNIAQIPNTLLKPHKINNIRLGTDASGCFIPSISSDGGFITCKLDGYTSKFIEYSIATPGKVLNIGSGYGILERLSLLLGSKSSYFCNDACIEHLNITEELTPLQFKKAINYIPGRFPNLEEMDGIFDIVGIFRVLHFMEPENLISAIKKINQLLKKGGILILTAETPYLGNWEKFIPEYEAKIKENELWPGYVSDTKKYESKDYKNKLPKFMHFLDTRVITRVLIENGFEIINCNTFSRADLFPTALLLDGRESVGAIARKVS